MELHQQSDLRDELKSIIPSSFSEEDSRKIQEDIAAQFSDAKKKEPVP